MGQKRLLRDGEADKRKRVGHLIIRTGRDILDRSIEYEVLQVKRNRKDGKEKNTLKRSFIVTKQTADDELGEAVRDWRPKLLP